MEQFRARFPGASEEFLQRRLAAMPLMPPAHLKPMRFPRKAGRVPRTRNANTWTEAEWWGRLRSGLRRTFRFWKPAVIALNRAKTPCAGPRGQKWAYLCAGCGKLFLRKDVNIDHKDPCGQLTTFEHIPEFIAKLTPESPDAFQVLCKRVCHQTKTTKERTP